MIDSARPVGPKRPFIARLRLVLTGHCLGWGGAAALRSSTGDHVGLRAVSDVADDFWHQNIQIAVQTGGAAMAVNVAMMLMSIGYFVRPTVFIGALSVTVAIAWWMAVAAPLATY